MRWIFVSIFLFCSVASAENQFSSWRKYSSAEFIAEEDSVAPGQKLTIGLDVHLAKNWHTYWVSPGDSGSPIKMSLTAQAGSQHFDLLTGPIQFPVPERFDSGPIASFVYADEVMFFAEVVIPDSAPV